MYLKVLYRRGAAEPSTVRLDELLEYKMAQKGYKVSSRQKFEIPLPFTSPIDWTRYTHRYKVRSKIGSRLAKRISSCSLCNIKRSRLVVKTNLYIYIYIYWSNRRYQTRYVQQATSDPPFLIIFLKCKLVFFIILHSPNTSNLRGEKIFQKKKIAIFNKHYQSQYIQQSSQAHS